MASQNPSRSANWHPNRVGYHRLAMLLCGATVVLLAAGALVVGTGSSLAVPDWPLAYGQFFPPMVGGILFEHGHRMIAGTVGVLTLLLTAWVLAREPRRWVRWLSVGALGAVVLQALLGGITVLLLLPKPISIGHALLAQLFFALTVLLAQVTAPEWGPLPASRQPGSVRLAGIVTLAALELELLLGAMVRHFNAGLAIPDFPLAFGRLAPPLDTFAIQIHFFHRLGALVVVVLVLGTGVLALHRHRADRPLMWRAAAMVAFLVAQVCLGGLVIWTQRGLAITTLHVVNAALLVGSTVLVTVRAWLLEAPLPAQVAADARSTRPLYSGAP
ncbi:MAG TPA: COX15/CtaA family protein [bacterium]|nr:COX15/CtaA family protein [bacterium]